MPHAALNLFNHSVAVFALSSLGLLGCRSNQSETPRPEAAEPVAAAPVAEEATIPEPADRAAAFGGDTAAMTRWNADEIAWFPYDEGIAAAAEAGVPAIAVVQAEWCGRCTEYSALFSEPEVVESTQDFVMILLEEADPAAQRHLTLDGGYVPRTVFLAPDGTPDRSLISSNPRYRHFMNPTNSGPLLALMDRAQETY